MSTSNFDSAASPRRGRGRRPSAQVRSEVLTAAADLLFNHGMTAVTFDRVASAAGASKTTLYKWWPTPGALAAEAYFVRVEPALHFPDTGDIVSDLRTQLNAFARVMQQENAGRALREIIGAAQTDPALLQALATGYSRPRREEAIHALQLAQERGQIRQDAPLDVLVDQLWGACYHRILLLDELIDGTLIDRFISNALVGVLQTP